MKFSKAVLGKDGIPPDVLREVTILKHLDHPNVIKFIDMFVKYEPKCRTVQVYELVTTDLKKYMDKDPDPLPPTIVRSFSQQILWGIHYCHERGIMHRDLKPLNILIKTNSRGEHTLKLADFGLACSFDGELRPRTEEVITLFYRAPEILLGKKNYSVAVDMWSIGCIIAGTE